MGTTIKIMLNDEKSINELANDPDVQIKIKNAIVDGIEKRTVKLIHDSVMQEVNKAINNAIQDIIELKDKTMSDILKKGDWRGPSLTDKYRDEIRAIVRNEIRVTVDEIIYESDIEKEYRKVFESRKKEIKEYDFDKAVKDYIAKRVSGIVEKLIK